MAKIAVHIPLFDNENFILRVLENCGPHVDIIYIVYSTLPLSYNKYAKKNYTNRSSLEILNNSRFLSKIKIIIGCWDFEEDYRNKCLEAAKEDGCDFLIVQDADEFYHFNDYKTNIRIMEENPHYEMYYADWINFWKSTKFVLQNSLGEIKTALPTFAVNCKKSIKFTKCRTTNWSSRFHLPGICYHLSYVRTNEEMQRKISTWGHSHQVKWFFYKHKWLKWSEKVKYLHPVYSHFFYKAVSFNEILPKEIQDFTEYTSNTYTMSNYEQIYDQILNFQIWFGFKVLKKVKECLKNLVLFQFFVSNKL